MKYGFGPPPGYGPQKGKETTKKESNPKHGAPKKSANKKGAAARFMNVEMAKPKKPVQKQFFGPGFGFPGFGPGFGPFGKK